MRKFFISVMAIGTFVTSAGAHHSTAAYDYTKEVTIEGTVKELTWTNPHMFIKIMGGAKGKKTALWSIECGTPNINIRHGWKKTDINPGDKLVLKIAPMRDGSPGGTLYSAKLRDGRTLFGPAGDIRSVGGPAL